MLEPAMKPDRLFSFELIEDAARRLEGVARRTPLLEAPLLNDKLGMRVLFKPECLQWTGSFKFRGAYTKISRMAEDRRDCPVVAFSSGNHAQGVAYAAALHGVKSTIVMPGDAPQIKIDNTRAYGAEIILYDRRTEDRAAIADALAAKTGAVLIPPFDDVDIMSGQGTAGLEIMDQAVEFGFRPDDVLCPAGGGGLLSGLAMAVKTRSPDTRIWCAEPEDYDDVIRSMNSGNRVMADLGKRSICDALMTPQVGVRTFEVIQAKVEGGFGVSDRQASRAMALAFENLKLVVEPGGAVALAALEAERRRFAGRTVVVVLSGGNVDAAVYRECLKKAGDR